MKIIIQVSNIWSRCVLDETSVFENQTNKTRNWGKKFCSYMQVTFAGNDSKSTGICRQHSHKRQKCRRLLYFVDDFGKHGTSCTENSIYSRGGVTGVDCEKILDHDLFASTQFHLLQEIFIYPKQNLAQSYPVHIY